MIKNMTFKFLILTDLLTKSRYSVKKKNKNKTFFKFWWKTRQSYDALVKLEYFLLENPAAKV